MCYRGKKICLATEMDKISLTVLDALESESKFWFFSSSRYALQEGAFKMLFLVKFFHIVAFPANVSSQHVSVFCCGGFVLITLITGKAVLGYVTKDSVLCEPSCVASARELVSVWMLRSTGRSDVQFSTNYIGMSYRNPFYLLLRAK